MRRALPLVHTGGAIYAQGEVTSAVRATIDQVASSSFASYVPFIGALKNSLNDLYAGVISTIPAAVASQSDVVYMVDRLQNANIGVGNVQVLSGSAMRSNSATSGPGGERRACSQQACRGGRCVAGTFTARHVGWAISVWQPIDRRVLGAACAHVIDV